MNFNNRLFTLINKNVGLTLLVLLAVVALIFVIYIVGSAFSPSLPTISEGQMDLSSWNFETDGVISLNGKWGFCWDHFVADPSQNPPADYVRVPEVWTSYIIDGEKLPGFGYATYTLKLYGLKEKLSLRLDHCATSYQLYIDGQLTAQNGQVGTSAEEAVPYYESKTVIFTPENNETTLTLYISNYVYARGGLWYPVHLGKPDQIDDINRNIMGRRIFIIGSIFSLVILCTYAFLLGIRKDALYYFVLMSLCAVIVVLVYGDYMLVRIVNSFRAAIVLEYVSITLFPMFIALFLESLLQQNMTMMKRIVPMVSTSFFIVTLITPVHIFTHLTLIFETWIIVITAYFVYSIIKSQNPYKLALSLGIIVFAISGVVDFLYQACVITSIGNFSPVGFLLMLLIFGFPLLQHYLSIEEERRRSFERSKNAELALLSAQIKPHFLYNALNAVANVCEKDGMKGSQLILDLAVYLRHKLEFTDLSRKVTLKQELDFVIKYFEIERARFGDKIHLEFQIEAPSDYEIPVLVLQPLVENAVKHGISKKISGGTVWVKAVTEGNSLRIEVRDDGVGIEPETMKALLEEGAAGASIGLLNIHHRLLHMYGRGLEIESMPELGTVVRVMIPGGAK